MNTDNLKECPFCGCWPHVGYVGDEDGGYWEVQCPTCTGSTSIYGRFAGVHSDDKDQAIKAWNKRI